MANLVSSSNGHREVWGDSIPEPLRQAGGNIQAAALHQLTDRCNLGGGKWVSQIIFGFPTTGVISQAGVLPRSDKAKPPISPQVLWKSSSKRFQERDARAGFKNAIPSWGEALFQAQLGWLSDPIPIDNIGMSHGLSLEGANFAFRFGVEQNGKLRAFDDLRQNMVNLRTSVYTPITLPTWDHISETAKRIRGSKSEWDVFKADNKDAYKQLLRDQEYANLTLVSLRHPTSGQWFAFAPRVLLFGAVSAVIHYNCFARIFSVLANKICGLPVFNYFGDFGSLVPDLIKKAGMQVLLCPTAVLGALMKGDNSRAGGP